jgi:para-aminobenzoate synthetase component I
VNQVHLFSKSLDAFVSPGDIFTLLYSNEERAFWLDREFHSTERFSVIGASMQSAEVEQLGDLRHVLGELKFDDDPSLPFSWRPGLVGVISYEGRSHFIPVDRAIVIDHDKRVMHFIGVFASEQSFTNWYRAALLRIGFSGGQEAAYLHENKQQEPVSARLYQSPQQYLNNIVAAQQFIAQGDVYQLCLTNKIQIDGPVDALAAFLRLRFENPAPYACFMRLGDETLVSASPEQFLSVSADGLVSTKPIKGTRPRGADEAEDSQIKSELALNQKERAENLMIVDLMRNDLGRVCFADSIKVPSLFGIETYATVHQLVSTITGQLMPNQDAVEAVMAAFPGGSMTGAPKIRAVELLSQLEAQPRGIYSGVAGYFGSNGAADFAMVIRSIVFDASGVSIGVGGGITSDSDPEAELEETRLKAKAMLSVLNASDPWL